MAVSWPRKNDTWTQVATEGVWFDALETVQETLDSMTHSPTSIILFLTFSFLQTPLESHFCVLYH